MILVAQAQEAIEAVGALRNDPAIYVLIVILISGYAVAAWLIKNKQGESTELRKENTQLVHVVIEQSKLSTEAITVQTEVMRSLQTNIRDSLARQERQTEKMVEDVKQIVRESHANN